MRMEQMWQDEKGKSAKESDGATKWGEIEAGLLRDEDGVRREKRTEKLL